MDNHEGGAFVIVGAGPTGVELAGAIGEIARQTLKNDFRSIHTEQFLRDKLVEHTQYVHEHGDDMPEVKNWSWPY